MKKIIDKPQKERLIIAGAFCMAEKDAYPGRFDNECDDLVATIIAELSTYYYH